MSHLKWHLDDVDIFHGMASWPDTKASEMLNVLIGLPTDVRFYVFNKPVCFWYIDNNYLIERNLYMDIGTVMATHPDYDNCMIIFEDSELDEKYIIHECVHNAYDIVDTLTKQNLFEHAMTDAKNIVDFVWKSNDEDVLEIKNIMKGVVAGLTEPNKKFLEFVRKIIEEKTGRKLSKNIDIDSSLILSAMVSALSLEHFYRKASELVDISINDIQFIIITISRYLLDMHEKYIPKYLSDEEIVAWICSCDRESSRDFFIQANRIIKGPLGIYS